MPIREALNAGPATLADVLSNGKRYLVPPFQRDYAWEETEWSELWTDIQELGSATNDLGNHYLGALVLQPTGARDEMNIIDGQQRLVTLSLLALAVIVRIEELAKEGHEAEANRERARLLRERFVSTKDPASLQHRSRLHLNATDTASIKPTWSRASRLPGRGRSKDPKRGSTVLMPFSSRPSANTSDPAPAAQSWQRSSERWWRAASASSRSRWRTTRRPFWSSRR